MKKCVTLHAAVLWLGCLVLVNNISSIVFRLSRSISFVFFGKVSFDPYTEIKSISIPHKKQAISGKNTKRESISTTHTKKQVNFDHPHKEQVN